MNNLRNKLFWQLDYLKGSPIGNNLKNIEELFGLSFEELKIRNKVQLNKLLEIASTQTDFYKAYIGSQRLEDFPVVNKTIIKENFENINIPIAKENKAHSVSTSGSTGTPFKILQSTCKKNRNSADTIFFAGQSGFTIGERLLYLRLWAAYYRKPRFLAWMQNIDQLDVEELDDTAMSKLVEELIRDKQSKAWLGYPSGFLKLCNFLDVNGYEPLKSNVKSIIAMSEPLDSHVRERMEYYFQCPVVSRYSNVENGIIAQQRPNEDNFAINWASYHIEVLDMEYDRPASYGEPGRIVVTDLYNFATPMIRYDTGDVGIMNIGDDGFPMFSSIQGRITDLLTNTEGEIVNPFIIYTNLYKYPELEQVQLIQKSESDYVFKVNSKRVFDREEEFLAFFGLYLGEGANISIEYVSEIPLLKSGKRKIIVNQS
ncbi:phenylacetate--CoA ligase family protein [Flagellimonas pacifica]|uniref:Phenylacetate-CoA ligase n=1 Tax=Flagellimonas pacifica TaxID=1247520 RepID=A0A285MR11_9FLAO|nr:phenylacetate--CoA ligase family protein [Allomuricauda parva]SNY99614.1 phenylacetate-CoA ligase [Allomuricauda parva]